ncbi:MAG TPA: DUF4230 domain-containing protein [Oligoflexia bacterium]|nr:DUF4230 domain-containing protein [Oligoflexia bacterium]
MGIFKKIIIYGLIMLCVAGSSVFLSYKLFSKHDKIEHKPFDMKVWVKDVLKLSVVEIQISQIHRFESQGIKLYDFSLPFTQQQSLIVTEGKVSLGYDLQRVQINENTRSIEVVLPEMTVQSIDLDFNFISETDPLLNRITPSMRNKMLADIKQQVSQSVRENYKEKIQSKDEMILKLLQKVSSKEVSIKKGDLD